MFKQVNVDFGKLLSKYIDGNFSHLLKKKKVLVEQTVLHEIISTLSWFSLKLKNFIHNQMHDFTANFMTNTNNMLKPFRRGKNISIKRDGL